MATWLKDTRPPAPLPLAFNISVGRVRKLFHVCRKRLPQHFEPKAVQTRVKSAAMKDKPMSPRGKLAIDDNLRLAGQSISDADWCEVG